MRDAITRLGGDPARINPQVPVHLVIDHSVMVDEFGTPKSFERNVELEYQRNMERYQFLKWGASAFHNFKVVPPGTGICHQVNLEHIARAVWSSPDPSGEEVAYFDTLVGTDSHTTMVNGLCVLGWGVGGIEAEAAMLGQPVSMLIPEVVGFHLSGALGEGITATDLVLTVTQMLRKKGVVGRFVEFYGPGVSELSLADRATIANMAPEYGATCGFFGIDEKTLDYLRLTGRPEADIALTEAYAREQGLWLTRGMADPVFTDTLELDMGSVEPSLAGPKRPQDKVLLSQVDEEFRRNFTTEFGHPAEELPDRFPVEDAGGGITDTIKGLLGRKPSHDLGHGDVVIAAITSCTNTSNPSVLVARRLVARKARERGLDRKPWGEDLARARKPGGHRLSRPRRPLGGSERDRLRSGRLWLHHLHRQFGAASGAYLGRDPRQRPRRRVRASRATAISKGRVSPDVRANYLASPPLVVAYALKGTVTEDMVKAPIGHDKRARRFTSATSGRPTRRYEI
jgi:aconitate hydratase